MSRLISVGYLEDPAEVKGRIDALDDRRERKFYGGKKSNRGDS